MSSARVVLLAVALAGCGGLGDPLGGRDLTEEPVSFGEDGLTGAITVPPFEGTSIALLARTDPGTCFQIASLEDADGRAEVSEREAGSYCERCGVRTSVAQGEGLFVLASEGAFRPGAGLSLRFGLVRCDTSTPLATAAGERLEVSALPREEVPERGRVSMRFLLSDHSMLLGRDDLQRALVDHLGDELAPAGLEVSLESVAELEGAPSEARFSSADLGELEALLELAPPAQEGTVDVVIAGCLRYADPFFGPPVAVDGFTPRVVGGAGPAAAIFLPGLRCDAPGESASTTYDLAAYAHLVAHELGHFLGLYHSVESDGTTDPLADTDDANLMYYLPALARARGLSPSQGRVMRSHPWVHPVGSP